MDDEPPLTEDDQAWWAALLAEVGPEGAGQIADLLGLDPDDL
ncbi:hypothetical protein Q8791_23370 [Nocardiopsis sp. CT-R113]|uniref:MarR family transcriptional regulator n=1 Tax=Nocardiopsis codii TaxID=3065942 RepID=A0ABU7KD55_9ACTN|nr:hypothetical protein [Nocardiopsis sp. CT-R113]MEE2040161.1 hypothetical protein [Nocardiopsis sp. CT-R113]